MLVPLAACSSVLTNSAGLPAAVINEIDQYQSDSIMSASVQLVSGIEYYQTLMDYTDNTLINTFLSDTTITSPYDSAQAILYTDAITPSRLAQLANLEWSAKENSEALTTLNTLKNIDKDSIYSNYCTLLPVLINLSSSASGYTSLKGNANDSNLLERIAMDSSKPGYENARAVLRVVYKQSFGQPIIPLESGSHHRPKKFRNSKDTSNTISAIAENHFNIFPNPANDKLTVQYSMDKTIQTSSMEIFDLLGDKIMSYQLPVAQSEVSENIANLSAGVYFYTIQTNGSIIQRGKLIIAR